MYFGRLARKSMYFGTLVAQNNLIGEFLKVQMVIRIMDDQSGMCDPLV